MKKTGIVFRKEHGPFNYNAWPTVAMDDNGVLYAVFSGNRVHHIDTFSKTLLCKSYDNGETWSLPTIINDGYLDDRDAGICYLGDNKFIISYFSHPIKHYYGRWNSLLLRYMTPAEKIMVLGALQLYKEKPDTPDEYGSFVRITEDGFNTIGEPIKLPISAPHGPVLLKDGNVGYLGTEMYATDDNFHEDNIYYYKSEDGGKTFNKVGQIPMPIDFKNSNYTDVCEPHFVDLGNGKLFGAIRLGEKVGLRTTMHFTTSNDGGKTWEEMHPSNIDGLPPHFTLLKDGRILLTYSRRNEPNQIEAVISSDGGKTFSEPIVVETFPKHAYEGDFGYPSSVELQDGSIVTIYYAIYGDDKKPSIMYTKWKI